MPRFQFPRSDCQNDKRRCDQMRSIGSPPWVLGWVVVLACAGAQAAGPLEQNGFSLEPSLIPRDQIFAGGPSRDGIPALDSPSRDSATSSSWKDDDLVVGVVNGSEARAYPLAILVWHELVNDELGDDPILVSYCPLCGTALVFDRRMDGRVHNFGVSGLLYQSDLLMFDRETESLWSQIEARAVTGARMGRRLEMLRSRIVSWKTWREAHPDTSVVSRKTGYPRDYGRSPYQGYETSNRLLFPVDANRSRHLKMPTLGLRVPNGPSRAYPGEEVARAGGRVEDRFANRQVVVSYDPETKRFDYRVPDRIEVVEGFWFAWMAFHPDSDVFEAPPTSE
jgi:hypothetical protein